MTELQGWRVKPLVWETNAAHCHAYGEAAGTNYMAAPSTRPDRIGEFRLSDTWSGFSYHPTLEAAKAAAQADYEARIMSALEPVTATKEQEQ